MGTVAIGTVAPTRAATPDANAVIALVDGGINPYHVVFRDDSPRAYRHPSTYIPGFPKDAKALRITLDEENYQLAVKKDCKLWRSVKADELYWFPGTKIIGAVAFTGWPHPGCATTPFAEGGILDSGGHGTMVASRAAGNGYGACPECRIVAIQGYGQGMRWAARNSDWIDVQSNSWGPFLPAWAPAQGDSLEHNTPSFVRDIEAAARRHLSFWATGNGAATRFGIVGHPTLIDPRMTPSIVMVGGHDSGYINLWPDFPPHVVSDSCNSWAAYSHHVTKSADNVGGGTSAASPFAAGGAARVLLEARRILGDANTGVMDGIAARGDAAVAKGPLKDGRFTLDEWKEVILKTATPRPEGQKEDGSVCGAIEGLVLYSSTPVKWSDVPEGYPEYLHIGYGAVDGPARDLAFDVIRGARDLPDRSSTDTYFGYDRQVRERLHDFFGG